MYKKRIYNLLVFLKLYTKMEPEKNKNVEANRKALFVSSLCGAWSIVSHGNTNDFEQR